ncbi:MAG: metal ABC transporter ATP-binding protein [Nitrospira sp.]|nr:metal ABC transporter ATP-binding protein [bacterium]MBL7049459.1 metal ABC transporter ATP-binding protein [Nitrospira sp.]
MIALSVDNLCVKAGDLHLVENVSFAVEQGSIIAIIGPNGAGKTTLIKAILGLIPYGPGTVSFFGREQDGRPDDIKLGYVPQKIDFDRTFPLTVYELLSFSVPPFYSLSLNMKRKEQEHIYMLLQKVGAGDLLRRQVGSLSGGELQRVMIAKALVNNPAILVLDEPASGVDIEGQERFHELVRRLNRDTGLTVLLISHDLNVVYRYADNVLCMNRRLICTGKPEVALTDEVIKSVYGEMMGGYIHSCHDHD